MSETFVPGDIVYLKSGGPAMTVSAFPMNNHDVLLIYCIWFNNGILMKDAFDTREITKERPNYVK